MTDAAVAPTACPLAATARAVDPTTGRPAVRIGPPADVTGWLRCSDVDAERIADWESRISAALQREHARSHPRTAAGYALSWYAGLPGHVGGAFFRLARRVPRLASRSLAFRLRPDGAVPAEIALLDPRFWCLPGDPAADSRDATVVADQNGLAAILRAQVRGHADDFIARYRGGARLPRRTLLGAFVDGLDTGLWFGGDPTVDAAPQVLADAAVVLPGATPEFADRSSLHVLTDTSGRDHLTRRRVACCYHFKVAADASACATCPRIDEAERARRYATREH